MGGGGPKNKEFVVGGVWPSGRSVKGRRKKGVVRRVRAEGWLVGGLCVLRESRNIVMERRRDSLGEISLVCRASVVPGHLGIGGGEA